MHAIDSSLGGLLRAKTKGECCRIKVMVEAHKPLRCGIFIQDKDQNKSWVPFKYERLPSFYFGCGCMGHRAKECVEIAQEVKDLPEDNLPFSLALKVEFNFLSRISMWLGAKIKSLSTQCSYLGDNLVVVVENGAADNISTDALRVTKISRLDGFEGRLVKLEEKSIIEKQFERDSVIFKEVEFDNTQNPFFEEGNRDRSILDEVLNPNQFGLEVTRAHD